MKREFTSSRAHSRITFHTVRKSNILQMLLSPLPVYRVDECMLLLVGVLRRHNVVEAGAVEAIERIPFFRTTRESIGNRPSKRLEFQIGPPSVITQRIPETFPTNSFSESHFKWTTSVSLPILQFYSHCN